MAKINGLHHLAIRARDFERSLAFYQQALGGEVYRSWGVGDSRIVLLTMGNGNFLELFAGGATEFQTENVLIHYAFATDDVDEMVARAIAAGAEMYVAPKMVDVAAEPINFRGRNAIVKGPDGELVEFFHDLP